MKTIIERIAVAVSMMWNMYIVAGVVLGASYALHRAAGGQFTSFPMSIRISYVVTFAILVWQAVVYVRFTRGMSVNPAWAVKVLFYVEAASFLVNVLSRSSLERWNAIPAGIVAYVFFRQWQATKA